MSNCGGKTKCDGDRKNNCWLEGPDDNTAICLLDTLTEDQVIYCLERDDRARQDLRRVTTDPDLLRLADTVIKLPEWEEVDELQDMVDGDRHNLPLYMQFHGQPPWNGGSK